MLQSVKTYVADRKRGLAKTAGFVGGVYLVGRYVSERLEEVKDKVVQERLARDSLRRRFQQNQEDIAYTIMALIPTLAEQILEEMDVEGVTHELQAKSRASKAARSVLPPHAHTHAHLYTHPPPPASESSLASSLDMINDHDARSDTGSAAHSVSSTSYSGHEERPSLAESSQSWVDRFPAAPPLSPREDYIGDASGGIPPVPQSPSANSAHTSEYSAGAHLSDSFTTNSSALSYGGYGYAPPLQAEHIPSPLAGSHSTSSRTKAELWNEVKMLTFTRTLTILYSTTLLSLFTTLQLTLLARSKYVHSVLQLERDERLRERLEGGVSTASLLLGAGAGLGGLGGLEGLMGQFGVGVGGGEARGEEDSEIPEDVETKYLTLSWWILHVGWKDVGERVRRGVEEVFDGVSLKTKLGAVDVHRLVSDVRRRVEYEITFEGTERRVDFLSSLLPPTPETTQHVLTQGGFVPSSPSPSLLTSPHDHPPTDPFPVLLSETRTILASPDFAHVLEASLDRAVAVLFAGLEGNVFVASEVGEGEEVRIRLAGLLPGLARWSQMALNGLPNRLVDGLMEMREVEALQAIVFSKFEERFR